ncbi:HAD hydrolase-like protein [Microcella daejeonensis]|uniref:HAD family hydrolase n=1 Tax=Microcella daejeonensis TaxID=2994971 RepID=UPI00226E4831|nr:HAD family hydrolase [Microcella daejeonensis]WAB83508.1 HAD hydrolase-like protein [Microcella daejeonensis]
MSPAPVTTVLLDVNETLTDLRPLDDWMRESGLPSGSASAWLAAVLRDGFAASLVGLPAAFGPLGASALQDLAREHLDAPAVESLLDQLPAVVAGLPAHDDVEPGIRSMIAAGLGVSTLTNGSPAIASALLERLGLAASGVGVLSVDGTRTWKPHAEAYLGACDRLGVLPEQTALVACHPWDILGAQRAGLQGVWLPRGRSWPAGYPEPHRTIETLGAFVTNGD